MKYQKPARMKKILFFLLLLFCISFSTFGITGVGSIGSPYSGPLISDMTWGGTVYVNGDVTVDGFMLTISPGAIIIFLASGSDIIITGTGVLTASGGPGTNMIRFTADFNVNGTYGEPGERWGHISFQNMTAGFTTPSIIDHCIVEFGQKNSTPFNFESSGGGIHTSFSYLTISNSIIRNNYAGWGGGILVDVNSSPNISNCIISNNTSGTTGGGILIYKNSSSVVSNCVIEKNTCLGAGSGGGAFVGDYADNVKFYNCTFASNLSPYFSIPNNIRIWKSVSPTAGPKFYNTIIWGSNNSISYYILGGNVSDFNYCAIQGYTSGYINCINLNGTNNDPAGPNFYNISAGSEDYRIQFISPCRDKGTSSNAPATDFSGNPRIGPYDIGAYEVQYSRWTGASSTVWETPSNWVLNMVPISTSNVAIPAVTNNPLISMGAVTVNNLVTESGGILTVAANRLLTVTNLTNSGTLTFQPQGTGTVTTLVNKGTLNLQSDASGIASLIIGTYTDNGTESIQLYLTGGGSPPNWHYISSPVASLSTSVFTTTTSNLAQYLENRISTDQNIGWVAYDGWIYLPLPSGLGGPTFSYLAVGHGYNHYFTNDHSYTFDGTFNTSDVIVPLAFNSGSFGTTYPNSQGFNLLGNPFSSCLDWSQIDATLDASISKAIYFNRNGSFAVWNNGVGTNDGTATIPPMQGFFVKAYASGKSITLPKSARVHNASQIRYKKSLTADAIPLVRLTLQNSTITDEAVVRFDNNATPAVDNDFDAYKFTKTGTSIWTSSEGVDFSINGLPFPETNVAIPVSVNSESAGNLQILCTQLDDLENYNVTLTDNVNNITIDLKTNPTLSFNAPGGTVAGRFILNISTIATAVPETKISDKPFNIYSLSKTINIQTLGDNWNGKLGGIKVLDMTGKIVTTENNITFSKDELRQLPVRVANGIYLVEIRSGLMRYVGKVVIK